MVFVDLCLSYFLGDFWEFFELYFVICIEVWKCLGEMVVLVVDVVVVVCGNFVVIEYFGSCLIDLLCVGVVVIW